MRYKDTVAFIYECPDCQANYQRLKGKMRQVSCGCGLTRDEHKQIAKARKRAEKQAHEVVFQARMSEVYPKAIIKATYDEAHRRVGG